MVQFRNAVCACLWFSVSHGFTSGPQSHQFNFHSAGNCDFVATNTNKNSGYVGAVGKYGFVNFKHEKDRKGSEAKFFMEGLDPNNFMQTGQANADQSTPTELNFAVEGNLSMSLENIDFRCPIRIGLRKTENHARWYMGGLNCEKSKAEPKTPAPGRPGLFQLECECDNATRVMFTMKESEDKKASDTVITAISDCTAVLAKKGYWAQMGSSPASQTVELAYGVDRTYTVSNTKDWSKSTTHSTKMGFKYEGFSISHEISHTTSKEFSITHTSTFETSEMTTYSTTVPAGVVWQFQMDINDNCGQSSVHMNDVVVTQSATEPPCCLPGYFVNMSNPHGDCITSVDGDNYNVCDPQRVLEDVVIA